MGHLGGSRAHGSHNEYLAGVVDAHGRADYCAHSGQGQQPFGALQEDIEVRVLEAVGEENECRDQKNGLEIVYQTAV